MKNKKGKFLAVLSLSAITAVSAGALAACGDGGSSGEEDRILALNTIYAMAQEAGYTGTLDELVQKFKGDKGDTGATGATGVGVQSATVNEEGKLILTLTNGNKVDCGNVVGEQGEIGASGYTPFINDDGYWVVGDKTYGEAYGKDAIGIESIKKTGTEGLVDTYTITFEGGKTATFTITNPRSIVKMEIKEGHLWVTYNDGTAAQDLGQVVGSKGDDGSKWLTADGKPENTVGDEGDFCLDTANKIIYVKTANGWEQSVSLGGAVNGKDGSQWYTGEGVPTAAQQGAVGDFYFDATNKVIYKKGESAWEKLVDLSAKDGTHGEDGTKWLTGAGQPTASTEAEVGDFYFDSTNKKIYQKQASGWTELADLNATGGTVTPEDGTKWYTGAGQPTASTEAEVGDFYFDSTNKKIYQKQASGWTELADLNVSGGTVTPGQPGADGTKWYTGEGAPNATLVVNEGDFYFDTANKIIYVKATEWEEVVNLNVTTPSAGTTTDVGTKWYTSTDIPTMDLGKTGDFCLDTVNKAIYQKDAKGWTKIMELGGEATPQTQVVTLTFDANGGDLQGQTTSITLSKGDCTELPVPTREGYEFLGWFAGEGVNAGQVTNVLPIMKSFDLIARWKSAYEFQLNANADSATVYSGIDFYGSFVGGNVDEYALYVEKNNERLTAEQARERGWVDSIGANFYEGGRIEGYVYFYQSGEYEITLSVVTAGKTVEKSVSISVSANWQCENANDQLVVGEQRALSFFTDREGESAPTIKVAYGEISESNAVYSWGEGYYTVENVNGRTQITLYLTVSQEHYNEEGNLHVAVGNVENYFNVQEKVDFTGEFAFNYFTFDRVQEYYNEETLSLYPDNGKTYFAFITAPQNATVRVINGKEELAANVSYDTYMQRYEVSFFVEASAEEVGNIKSYRVECTADGYGTVSGILYFNVVEVPAELNLTKSLDLPENVLLDSGERDYSFTISDPNGANGTFQLIVDGNVVGDYYGGAVTLNAFGYTNGNWYEGTLRVGSSEGGEVTFTLKYVAENGDELIICENRTLTVETPANWELFYESVYVNTEATLTFRADKVVQPVNIRLSVNGFTLENDYTMSGDWGSALYTVDVLSDDASGEQYTVITLRLTCTNDQECQISIDNSTYYVYPMSNGSNVSGQLQDQVGLLLDGAIRMAEDFYLTHMDTTVVEQGNAIISNMEGKKAEYLNYNEEELYALVEEILNTFPVEDVSASEIVAMSTERLAQFASVYGMNEDVFKAYTFIMAMNMTQGNGADEREPYGIASFFLVAPSEKAGTFNHKLASGIVNELFNNGSDSEYIKTTELGIIQVLYNITATVAGYAPDAVEAAEQLRVNYDNYQNYVNSGMVNEDAYAQLKDSASAFATAIADECKSILLNGLGGETSGWETKGEIYHQVGQSYALQFYNYGTRVENPQLLINGMMIGGGEGASDLKAEYSTSYEGTESGENTVVMLSYHFSEAGRYEVTIDGVLVCTIVVTEHEEKFWTSYGTLEIEVGSSIELEFTCNQETTEAELRINGVSIPMGGFNGESYWVNYTIETVANQSGVYTSMLRLSAGFNATGHYEITIDGQTVGAVSVHERANTPEFTENWTVAGDTKGVVGQSFMVGMAKLGSEESVTVTIGGERLIVTNKVTEAKIKVANVRHALNIGDYNGQSVVEIMMEFTFTVAGNYQIMIGNEVLTELVVTEGEQEDLNWEIMGDLQGMVGQEMSVAFSTSVGMTAVEMEIGGTPFSIYATEDGGELTNTFPWGSATYYLAHEAFDDGSAATEIVFTHLSFTVAGEFDVKINGQLVTCIYVETSEIVDPNMSEWRIDDGFSATARVGEQTIVQWSTKGVLGVTSFDVNGNGLKIGAELNYGTFTGFYETWSDDAMGATVVQLHANFTEAGNFPIYINGTYVGDLVVVGEQAPTEGESIVGKTLTVSEVTSYFSGDVTLTESQQATVDGIVANASKNLAGVKYIFRGDGTVLSTNPNSPEEVTATYTQSGNVVTAISERVTANGEFVKEEAVFIFENGRWYSDESIPSTVVGVNGVSVRIYLTLTEGEGGGSATTPDTPELVEGQIAGRTFSITKCYAQVDGTNPPNEDQAAAIEEYCQMMESSSLAGRYAFSHDGFLTIYNSDGSIGMENVSYVQDGIMVTAFINVEGYSYEMVFMYQNAQWVYVAAVDPNEIGGYEFAAFYQELTETTGEGGGSATNPDTTVSSISGKTLTTQSFTFAYDQKKATTDQLAAIEQYMATEEANSLGGSFVFHADGSAEIVQPSGDAMKEGASWIQKENTVTLTVEIAMSNGMVVKQSYDFMYQNGEWVMIRNVPSDEVGGYEGLIETVHYSVTAIEAGGGEVVEPSEPETPTEVVNVYGKTLKLLSSEYTMDDTASMTDEQKTAIEEYKAMAKTQIGAQYIFNEDGTLGFVTADGTQQDPTSEWEQNGNVVSIYYEQVTEDGMTMRIKTSEFVYKNGQWTATALIPSEVLEGYAGLTEIGYFEMI